LLDHMEVPGTSPSHQFMKTGKVMTMTMTWKNMKRNHGTTTSLRMILMPMLSSGMRVTITTHFGSGIAQMLPVL